MIAALYVADGGVYYGLDGVEPWGLPDRDAREYAGPWPVVAHPPCQRWGRYWHGGPSAKVRKVKGDDEGCFAAALEALLRYGGVLEHPEASAAWPHFGLQKPPKSGGWVRLGPRLWTCCVEQGHYGHRARKATWLLYCGSVAPPELTWGRSGASVKLDHGFHSAEEREAAGAKVLRSSKRMSQRERAATPVPFRDLLLGLARLSAEKTP